LSTEQSPTCPHGRRTGTYRNGRELGAFVEPRPDTVMERPVDTGLPLAGLRIAVKDNIDVAGWVTGAGSHALPSHVASADARVVARLRAAGAAIDAKTRMDEFAITTFGPQMSHPVDPALSVGGSSGGSGLAVAAGGYCAALGTDTGGSVRIPASYCGVVGFKPTFGAVSVENVIPLSPSLDHVGVFACCVTTAGDVFRVARDEVTGTGGGRRFERLDQVRIGIPDETYLAASSEEVAAAFAATVQMVEDLGATVEVVRLPHQDRVLPIHYTIVLVEAAKHHDKTFPDLSAHGEEIRHLLETGRGYSVQSYERAQDDRRQLTAEVSALLDELDVLLLPTTPTTPPPRHAQPIRLGTGDDVDAVTGNIWYTALFNDTGHPAISIPVDGSGLSPAVQLVGPHGGDEVALETAALLETALADLHDLDSHRSDVV
jgi:aspartyl-tRNA(Asn)/glutamyl-tRNA(Gln) amidotransferase subunit A